MAKVRQAYGEPVFVPWVGRTVDPGEEMDVPDDDLASYLEAGWHAADGDTDAKHQEMLKSGRVTVGEVKADPPPKPPAGEDDTAAQPEQDPDTETQEED